MKPVQTLLRVFDRVNASSAEAARPRVRRAPECEMLEERQLLNAEWSPLQEFPGWDGAAAKGLDAASSLSSTQLKGLQPSGRQSGRPSSNLTANLTAAGVSSSQNNTITTDLQNLKNALDHDRPDAEGQDRRR